MKVAVFVDFSLTVAVLLSAVGAVYGVAALADMGVVNKASLTLFLSVSSPMVTMCQFVAPIPVVSGAMRSMSVQSMPTPVFQSQAACNVLSIAYAIQISNAAVLVTNMFGILMQILYLAGDHYIRTMNSSWLLFGVRLSILLNVGIFSFAALVPIKQLGQAITLMNVVLFAAPLTQLATVLRTRNSSSIPSTMTFISVANNGTWMLYGLMIEDMVLLLPSILGFLLSGFQVLVIFWCRSLLPFDLGFLLMLCNEPSVDKLNGKIEEVLELGDASKLNAAIASSKEILGIGKPTL